MRIEMLSNKNFSQMERGRASETTIIRSFLLVVATTLIDTMVHSRTIEIKYIGSPKDRVTENGLASVVSRSSFYQARCIHRQ